MVKTQKNKTDGPIDVLAPAPSSCDASFAQELRSMRLVLEYNVHSQELARQDSNARDIRNDQTLRAMSQNQKETMIQMSADHNAAQLQQSADHKEAQLQQSADHKDGLLAIAGALQELAPSNAAKKAPSTPPSAKRRQPSSARKARGGRRISEDDFPYHQPSATVRKTRKKPVQPRRLVVPPLPLTKKHGPCKKCEAAWESKYLFCIQHIDQLDEKTELLDFF